MQTKGSQMGTESENHMSAFFDDIDDALNKQHDADTEASDAPSYDPQAGDLLEAVLLKVEPFTKGKFLPTFILTFRNVGEDAVGGVEPGASAILVASTVLRTKFFEAQPAPGTPFALRVEGTVKPERGGNSYKDWTLLTAYMKSGDASDVAPELWHDVQRKLAAVPQQATSGPASGGPFTTGDSAEGWKF